MFELNNFDSIKIGIASPEKLRQRKFVNGHMAK